MPLNSPSCCGLRILVSWGGCLRDWGQLNNTRLLDIERTYGGGRKPIASRVPLSWGEKAATAPASSLLQQVREDDGAESATPGITEGN